MTFSQGIIGGTLFHLRREEEGVVELVDLQKVTWTVIIKTDGTPLMLLHRRLIGGPLSLCTENISKCMVHIGYVHIFRLDVLYPSHTGHG